METTDNKSTVEELDAVAAKFAGIHQKMNSLVTLTPEQRKAKWGMRIGARKLRLLENRVAAAAANPSLLPGAFDLAKLERDTAISVALSNILTVLGKIWDSVNDTLLVVGGPAVTVAAEANSHIKLVSESARRLAPTDRASRGRSSAKPAIPVSTPVRVEPPQPAEAARELPTEPARKAV